jgi:hypothetical protein
MTQMIYLKFETTRLCIETHIYRQNMIINTARPFILTTMLRSNENVSRGWHYADQSGLSNTNVYQLFILSTAGNLSLLRKPVLSPGTVTLFLKIRSAYVVKRRNSTT